MTITVNSNRVGVYGGSVGKSDRRRNASIDEKIVVPARADINHIPDSDSLMTLINSAIASFRRGIVWDRGTILNLLA